jgi:pyruvate/2-oxoglutarate dehydrogenase complex dihydrolipoamide dehydrogenase (E3) component
VVIGAGPAGLAAAEAAAHFGIRTLLIEKNTGTERRKADSVPSKTLIRTARAYGDMRNAADYGATPPKDVHVDFARLKERLLRIRGRIDRLHGPLHLRQRGVELVEGEARFTGPDSVTVNGRTIRFRKALIATGSRPSAPEIPGLKEAGYLDSDTLFHLEALPKRMLVIGGGPLGCEFAQAFCRLGVQVVIAEDEAKFLPLEERDAAQILSDSMARDGVEIHLNTTVTNVRMQDGCKVAELVSNEYHTLVTVDEILAGVGRVPNIDNLGLEEAGVEADAQGGVKHNGCFVTANPRIYAAGDVCLPYRFANTGEISGLMAVDNAFFLGRQTIDFRTIPWCTYTDPEIAHVGIHVWGAWAEDMPVKTYTVFMQDVHRAIIDGEDHGFVKIHVKNGTDKILGATIVASHAGEMINAIALAMHSGVGLSALARTPYAYPTQSIAIRMAAMAYERKRADRWWPRWLRRLRLPHLNKPVSR